MEFVVIGAVVAVLLVVAIVVFVIPRRRSAPPAAEPRPGIDYRPGVGDDAEPPVDTATRDLQTLPLPDDAVLEEARRLPTIPERPERRRPAGAVALPGSPVQSRRSARLLTFASGSGWTMTPGRGRGHPDHRRLGVAQPGVVDRLRTRVRGRSIADPAAARRLLREELLAWWIPPWIVFAHCAPCRRQSAAVVLVAGERTGKTRLSASWLGCWSPTTAMSCSALRTPSAPRYRSADDMGRSGGVPTCVASRRRSGERRVSTRCGPASSRSPTSCWSTPRPAADEGRLDGRVGQGQAGSREAWSGG